MIEVTDPLEPTFLNRTVPELEEFLCFAIAVAGKNAQTTRWALQYFWASVVNYLEAEVGVSTARLSPFQLLNLLDKYRTVSEIEGMVKCAGIGCYTLKARALVLAAKAKIDLRRCKVGELEALHGVGPKTARFFLLFSRENARYACLDTHILKWMRERGMDVPKSTPTGKRYRELEKQFLAWVPSGVPVADFDLAIWTQYHKEVKVKGGVA